MHAFLKLSHYSTHINTLSPQLQTNIILHFSPKISLSLSLSSILLFHRITTAKLSEMSTDLDLRRTLLEIVRRPAIKLQIPRPSSMAADHGGVIQKERIEDAATADEFCCRTPTSAENKIPVVLQCPPAPRKRKRPPTCRRRLIELEFVEIVNREEIEPYLTSSFEHEDRVKKSAKRSFCECK